MITGQLESKPRLSDLQQDLLRTLVVQGGPIPVDQLDRRVVNALERWGFVERRENAVSVSESGAEYFNTHIRRRRKVRTRAQVDGTRSARVEAILDAVSKLELVLAPDTIVTVGSEKATGAEVLEGFRQFATTLNAGVVRT
jgi:hypothetical protein